MSQIIKIRHVQICLLGLLVVINLCGGNFLQMSVTEKHLCGAELADILTVLCKGKLNPMLHKKSVNEEYFNDDNNDDDGYSANQIDETQFLTKLSNGAIYPRVRRSWMSVTDECCKKPCSVATLRAYCV